MAKVNYQALCRELFGTDDVQKLREIARVVGEGNPRNAGRKKKFNEKDVRQMLALLSEGYTVNEVAERFHTTRQTVSRVVNAPPSEKYPLRMTYMFRQFPTTVIHVDFIRERICIQNRTDDVLHRAFGVMENPDWEDFRHFLEDRCFPATRGNVKQLLAQLQVGNYDPLQIVEKTAGRMAEDDLWLKFDYYEGGRVRGTGRIK